MFFRSGLKKTCAVYKNKSELLKTHPSELSPDYQPDGKDSFIKAKDMMHTQQNTEDKDSRVNQATDGGLFLHYNVL